jgi:hypothetical protein
MLEELLKCEKLGSRDELLFLLFNALPLSKSQKISDLKAYCTSNHFSIGQSLDGMLKLLEFMGLISIAGNTVFLKDNFQNSINKTHAEYFEQSDFIKILFLSLKNENAIGNFITPDAIKQDINEGVFYVKGNLIPLQYLGIRNLLISLDFFVRDTLFGTNNLGVNKSFTVFFEAEIVNSIKEKNQKRKRRRSLLNLKNQIEDQELMGKEAELFVLDFEQQRLDGHPSIDSVQRISEEYVGAGFDIESFGDKSSVFLDRFIEVKSYSENAIFYWSQNEVETAKEFGEKYFLYLVDRTKMSQRGYAPRIFQNPYQNIFENGLWNKEPQVWKFSLQENL